MEFDLWVKTDFWPKVKIGIFRPGTLMPWINWEFLDLRAKWFFYPDEIEVKARLNLGGIEVK